MKNKIRFITSVLVIVISTSGYTQSRFFTRTGQVSFFSKAPLENIEAHNDQLTSIVDFENGELVFSVAINGFQFKKALMQEHFNENYLESSKFPKSTFKARIVDFKGFDLTKDHTESVEVDGTLTLHGVAQRVQIKGDLSRSGKNVGIKAKFNIHLADYDIKIPKTVVNNIAETVEVSVDLNLEPYKK